MSEEDKPDAVGLETPSGKAKEDAPAGLVIGKGGGPVLEKPVEVLGWSDTGAEDYDSSRSDGDITDAEVDDWGDEGEDGKTFGGNSDAGKHGGDTMF